MHADIPAGWQRVRLGDLGRFVNGRAFKPADWGESGLPIVRIQNLTSADAPFNRYDGAVHDDHLIKTGDIVVSWSASIEARTWDRGPAILNQHIFKVIERGDVTYARFLFFLLEATTTELRRRVHGTTMQHVTKGTFDSTSVLLPPLAEQRAIAAVLDAVDDTIERTEAVIAATEELRRSLLHEVLTRGVPGWHSEWKQVPGLGTVPACWDVVTLGECLGTPPTNGLYKPQSDYGSGTYLVRIDDFDSGQMRRLQGFHRVQASADEVDRFGLRAGDIVLNRVNSIELVGKAVLFPGVGEPAMFESNMMRIRTADGVSSEFIAIELASPRSRAYFTARAKKAVQQASVNQQDVGQFPIALPGHNEQERIASLDNAFRQQAKAGREHLAQLSVAKASVADALLSGRVRVPARIEAAT